ncbi:MAG: polyamine aminopropyltransferase [Simkania sp.]|nr:polyamine aminopropyltransferase [Simkania sp.]
MPSQNSQIPTTSSSSDGKEWYTETLYDHWRQTFCIEEKIYEETTEQQHLIIFKNSIYGKVLALDGIIQVTEKDEFVYHEMMTHIPLLTHGQAKNILIIGGGDGGILREVLKHKTVEKVTLVEIDASVIHFSKMHLPNISQGAFDNPRALVLVQDGCAFVKNTPETFDVIICDSSDPTGPSAVLFTSEFYGDCHKALNPGGIFVNQNGVPFMQKEELIHTLAARKLHFKDAAFYLGVLPTYVGGFMAFGWASDNKEYQSVSVDELEERLHHIEGELKYYTPAIHKASFALPKFIENFLK